MERGDRALTCNQEGATFYLLDQKVDYFMDVNLLRASPAAVVVMTGHLWLIQLVSHIHRKVLMEQSLKKSNKKKPMSCTFCKSSNELENEVFTTHQLKDSQSHVMCPILYILKCPKCGWSPYFVFKQPE